MRVVSEREKVVKLALIRIGVKCDLIGYTYLVNAIEESIENPMLVYNLKDLFSIVAQKCDVKNPFRVEANIQNAITFTYNTKGFKSFNTLYGMEVINEKYKPTTAEVIKLVAEYYTLGLYKKAK